MFTTVQDAIDNLPEWARRIVLLNGTYSGTGNADISLGNTRDLEIIGESAEEVVFDTEWTIFKLASGAGSNTHKYKLANFKIYADSFTAVCPALIDIGSTFDAGIDIELDRLILEVNTTAFHDPIALRYLTAGKVAVKNCQILGTGTGGRAIYAEYCANLFVINNKVSTRGYSILLYKCDDFTVIGNICKDWTTRGIYAYGDAGDNTIRGLIAENILTASTSYGANAYGIHVVYGTKIKCGNNQVFMNGSGSGPAGVVFANCERCHFTNNEIEVTSAHATSALVLISGANSARCRMIGNGMVGDAATTAKCYGHYLSVVTASQIANNNVLIGNNNAAGAEGTRLLSGSTYNVVEGNQYDLVNSQAADYGLNMRAGADNNRGVDNMAWSMGTAKVDAGAGNNVLVNGA
jgi:parallel beta-helix repeat protein